MRQSTNIELTTGFFVLLGIAALFFLTTQTTNIDAYGTGDSYNLTARFNHVGTLKIRSPVSISGVTIGRVKDISFDSQRLEAVVTMRIDAAYNEIPDDSDASVLTAGLLGGQYIGIEPGGSEPSFKIVTSWNLPNPHSYWRNSSVNTCSAAKGRNSSWEN